MLGGVSNDNILFYLKLSNEYAFLPQWNRFKKKKCIVFEKKKLIIISV